MPEPVTATEAPVGPTEIFRLMEPKKPLPYIILASFAQPADRGVGGAEGRTAERTDTAEEEVEDTSGKKVFQSKLHLKQFCNSSSWGFECEDVRLRGYEQSNCVCVRDRCIQRQGLSKGLYSLNAMVFFFLFW